MSRIDVETKRKLREMGVPTLVDALEVQDDALTLGMVFEERVKLAVDGAHAVFTHSKSKASSEGPGCATRTRTCVGSICSNSAALIGA